MQELDEGFTGVVLTFAPAAGFQKEKKQGTFLPFLKQRLKGRVGVLAKLVYIGILLFFPGLILPVLSQTFIDDAVQRLSGLADQNSRTYGKPHIVQGFPFLLPQYAFTEAEKRHVYHFRHKIPDAHVPAAHHLF